ncbi:MAG: hypothetical protein V3S68_00730 [Dehalococcoidia bacterium]
MSNVKKLPKRSSTRDKADRASMDRKAAGMTLLHLEKELAQLVASVPGGHLFTGTMHLTRHGRWWLAALKQELADRAR